MPDGGNSIMHGGKYVQKETLDTIILVLSTLSAASVSTISAVSSLSHSNAILFTCFYSILLRNSRNKNDVTKMIIVKTNLAHFCELRGGLDWGNAYHKKHIS